MFEEQLQLNHCVTSPPFSSHYIYDYGTNLEGLGFLEGLGLEVKIPTLVPDHPESISVSKAQ